MKRYAYSRWDGTQEPFRLSEEDIMDRFVQHLMDTGEIRISLAKLLREGFQTGEGIQVKGLNQLRRELEEIRKQWFETYHLDPAHQELKERLQRIVDEELREVSRHYQREYQRLAGKGESARAELEKIFNDETVREIFLKNLPAPVSKAIEELGNYDFLSETARREYEELRDLLEDIKRFEQMMQNYGGRFQGKIEPKLERALEIARELERLENLLDALEKGDMQRVNMGDLKEFLGVQGFVSMGALKQVVEKLMDAGYLSTEGGSLDLTPRGIRKVGERALKDIYLGLKEDLIGGHQANKGGQSELRPEQVKPYQFGDPLMLDVVGTIKNAILRNPGARPVRLHPKDLLVYDMEERPRSSTALLLDMSLSMTFGDKFSAMKKVAIALDHLIRSRFPRDNLYLVGFYSTARELKTTDLPTLNPLLSRPFTNMQDALRLASRLLDRDPGSNRQIILITDGQPTAFHKDGMLHFEWPFWGISPEAIHETLKDVKACTRKGIRINVFMLDDDPVLKTFVDEVTRINKGRAFYSQPDQLGRYLLVDYIEGKKKVI